ncbi:MAG: hypothetical protein KC708_22955 [Anaerolineae bacterium]|nr:hypothetical protein [Anaerolineae bacterium]
MPQPTVRETHIATELGDIVLLAVQENGEIIGYLPYHRTERTILSLSESQLNRLFTKMANEQAPNPNYEAGIAAG